MDSSINAMVNASVALQQHNATQDAQAGLLKKSLDSQAASVDQLMEAVAPQPQLATSGDVGTNINTYA
ncbi:MULTISPECIES: YjfB family protein [Larsenimonas]|uniref:YjfB family protein n=1 Tax=Larsenimonas suaedae TaxID=1851019 RepID=A0ABU1GTF2_9GAMM|nr:MULTISPECIES: YjfB family protein [Larsenimonas]MCM2971764.1 YjfB family protein [Larsenimonas suaedae]MCM5703873.1 YjfB family protein [Larsenimonas salina]MDR5895316.1 YjfB family protein [Larsenimonas suaedae]